LRVVRGLTNVRGLKVRAHPECDPLSRPVASIPTLDDGSKDDGSKDDVSKDDVSKQALAANLPDVWMPTPELRDRRPVLAVAIETPCQNAVVVTFAELLDQLISIGFDRLDRRDDDPDDAAVTALVDTSERFSPIQVERLYRLLAFGAEGVPFEIEPSYHVAGLRVEIQVLPGSINGGIDQERLAHRIGWELLALEATALCAAQQHVRPDEQALGEGCLRAEMFDISAVRVFAVHAALGLARHALQCSLDVAKAARLTRIPPDALGIELRVAALSICKNLLSAEPEAHPCGQREAVDPTHADLQFLFGLEQLQLLVLVLFLRRQASTGSPLASILRELSPRIDRPR
jgi:hypothetical protein